MQILILKNKLAEQVLRAHEPYLNPFNLSFRTFIQREFKNPLCSTGWIISFQERGIEADFQGSEGESRKD